MFGLSDKNIGIFNACAKKCTFWMSCIWCCTSDWQKRMAIASESGYTVLTVFVIEWLDQGSLILFEIWRLCTGLVQFPTFCGPLSRHDEDCGSVGEANEDNQKKEWNNFYKKQMNLRKVSLLLSAKGLCLCMCKTVYTWKENWCKPSSLHCVFMLIWGKKPSVLVDTLPSPSPPKGVVYIIGIDWRHLGE